MTNSESDIERAAREIVEAYGADARSHAAARAEAILAAGDEDGYARWRRIVIAIERLSRGAGARGTIH
jgi:hypothetical protein